MIRSQVEPIESTLVALAWLDRADELELSCGVDGKWSSHSCGSERENWKRKLKETHCDDDGAAR